jgi:hypothetical protein
MENKITQDKQNWYCIKFDVPKDKNITALEFSQKMNAFLEQINEFNHSIVNGIDETYTVASYVEDFESGSVKWWLLDKLNKVDDKAIDKFVDSPIKTTIAGILKISKKKAIQYLGSDDFKQIPLEERKMKIINPIVEEIESKKDDLNRNVLSPQINIDEERLLKSLSNMSEISKELEENISFIDDYSNQDEQITISKDFSYDDIASNPNIEEKEEEKLLQSTNEIEDIYTLLTPTSKEDCKWELDDNGSKIKCVIEDTDFFNKYRSNQEKLGGNEKLKIKMKIETFLEGDKIKKEYTILKVLEKIPDRNLFNWQDDKKS